MNFCSISQTLRFFSSSSLLFIAGRYAEMSTHISITIIVSTFIVAVFLGEYFMELRQKSKVKRRPNELRMKTAFVHTRKDGQRVVCLCVKNSWMKSLSVPCNTEQLAKLDQWQCHSVHTPPSSHTYLLCFVPPRWHGHCHTPFRHSLNTQHKVRDGWISFSHTSLDFLRGVDLTIVSSWE